MTALALDNSTRLDMGRVFEMTSDSLKRSLPIFWPAGLLLCALPALLAGILQLAIDPKNPGGLTFLISAVGLVQLVTVTILQAALIQGVVIDLNGETPTLAQCLRVGRAKWLRLVGLSILYFIVAALGLALFVAPGLLIATVWCVSTPALVVENIGIRASLGRSRALTKGRRWPVFWLLCLSFLAFAVAEFGLVALTGGIVEGQRNPVRQLLVTPGISFVLYMAWPVFLTVIYVQLRVGREGVSPESIGETFD